MDFQGIKKFLKKGDKYIFVEDNKPSYVLMHYDDYEAMLKGSAPAGAHSALQKPKVGFADLNPARAQDAAPAEDEFIRGLSLAERYDAAPRDAASEETSHIRLEDLPL